MTDASREKLLIRDRFWVVGPIGLLLAYFWQPALRLMVPFVMTSVASLFVVGLIAFERAASITRPRLSRLLYLSAALLTCVGVGEVIWFASAALAVSDANDRRCRQIEVDMLSDLAHPVVEPRCFRR